MSMTKERVEELRDIVRNFIPTRSNLRTLRADYDGVMAYKDLLALLDEKAEQLKSPGPTDEEIEKLIEAAREKRRRRRLRNMAAWANDKHWLSEAHVDYCVDGVNKSIRNRIRALLDQYQPGPTDEERRGDDEHALARLSEAVGYLSPSVVLPVVGGGMETLVSLCKAALAHVRRRLQSPPKASVTRERFLGAIEVRSFNEIAAIEFLNELGIAVVDSGEGKEGQK